MKTMIPILAVIAVIQIGLAVWAFSGKTQLHEQAASSTLLAFEKAQIDQISISDADNTLTLSKQDGHWQTADAFPLESGKMDALLDKLSGLKFGLPVATSEAALKRFKVAEDAFERRVLLKKSGDTVVELYLGTGSGVRKSHLRNAEQDAVYVADIGSYDLPVAVGEWQDKTVLQLDKDEVTGIQLGDLKLSLLSENPETPATAAKASASSASTPKRWQTDSLTDGQQLNQAAINEALSSFSSLRFSKVLGKEAKPEYQLDQPIMSVSLTHTDGERHYQLTKLKDADHYVMKVSGREEYFELAEFTGKSLLEKVTREAWVMDKLEVKEVDKAEELSIDQPNQLTVEPQPNKAVGSGVPVDLIKDEAPTISNTNISPSKANDVEVGSETE